MTACTRTASRAMGYGVVPCAPAMEGMLHLTIRTEDNSAGTARYLVDVAQILFVRHALIAMDAAQVTIPPLGRTLTRFDTSFVVRNIGWLPDTLTVTVDPGNVEVDTALSVSPKYFVLMAGDSQKVTLTIRPSLLLYSYYGAQVIVEAKATMGQKKFQKNYSFQVVTRSPTGKRSRRSIHWNRTTPTRSIQRRPSNTPYRGARIRGSG